MNHNKLLVKLSSVGASPHVVNWFKSYLTGRSQSVRINSILSDPLPITHGVPQGAILSPLLFCIYLNDLPCAPQVCGLESYVEGSKVFLSFSLPDVDTAIANLEQDLLHVAAWCCENQLLINPDKTKFEEEVFLFSCGVFSGQVLRTSPVSEGFRCYPGLSPHI